MKSLISLCIILIITIYYVPLIAGPQQEVLTVSVLNWDGTPALSIQFPGAQSVPVENPWIRSPQYLRVIYFSDEAIWGIRIITDNETNIGQVYPKPLNIGPDRDPDTPGVQNEWEWERLGLEGYQYISGEWQTGDDSVSFGGLIDPNSKDNPNFRADIAWQVFADPVPEPDSIYKHPLYGWNVGTNPVYRNGKWIYPREWAYVVDSNNKWDGQPVLGEVFYPSPPYSPWSPKYEMVVTGNPFLSYLTQYPPMQLTNPDPRPGDCDIAVYLAACFGNMENDIFVATLPAGNYGTKLYLQLIHE